MFTVELLAPTGSVDIKSLTASAHVDIEQLAVGYFPAEIKSKQGIRFLRCQFSGGGIIRCETPELSFVECDARSPLTVASLSEQDPTGLVELSGTNLEFFVLSGLDMTATMFTDS